MEVNRNPGKANGAGSPAAPLFRAEALAARRQKLYGSVLAIRPLSITGLGWLALAIGIALLGLFVLGRYAPIIAPQKATSLHAHLAPLFQQQHSEGR